MLLGAELFETKLLALFQRGQPAVLGIIGLFVGAVVLSLGYELSRGWLQNDVKVGDDA